jgi:hypothetical protein
VSLPWRRLRGPFWLGLDVAVLVALLGLRRAVAFVRHQRTRVIPTGIVLASAALLSAWWTAAKMSSASSLLVADNRDFGSAARQIPAMLDRAIGLFGWCDTPMPHWMYLFGRVLLGSAVLLALVIGTWKHRLLVAGAAAVTAALTVVFVASNPGVCVAGQARYTLAIGLVVPVVCGHVFTERRDRIPQLARRALSSAAVAGVAALQFGAWYVNSRLYAVGGTGSLDFLAAPEWSPPGGWSLWFACAIAGTLLILVGGLLFPPSRDTTKA